MTVRPPSADATTYVPLETCASLTASHDGIDVRQYVDPPTRTRLWMCAGCAGIATSVGAAFIPDRRSDASRRDRGPVAGSLLTRLRGMVA